MYRVVLLVLLVGCSATNPNIYHDCAAFKIRAESPPFEKAGQLEFTGTYLPQGYEPVGSETKDSELYVVACHADFSKNTIDR